MRTTVVARVPCPVLLVGVSAHATIHHPVARKAEHAWERMNAVQDAKRQKHVAMGNALANKSAATVLTTNNAAVGHAFNKMIVVIATWRISSVVKGAASEKMNAVAAAKQIKNVVMGAVLEKRNAVAPVRKNKSVAMEVVLE